MAAATTWSPTIARTRIHLSTMSRTVPRRSRVVDFWIVERTAALGFFAMKIAWVPGQEEFFARGLEAYRAGNHYEAHEHWEILWRDEPDPEVKAFLQGLILVAAAMHKLERMGSPAGAVRLLERAGARLAGIPEVAGGLWIARLREDVARARDAIARLPEGPRAQIDPALRPRMPPAGMGAPS